MPQRTVAEAQEQLEELAPQLNPPVWKKLNAELNEVVSTTNQRAVRYMDESVASATAAAKETLVELCDVRDQLAALTVDGEAGRLTATEFNKRHQELTEQHRRLHRRVEKLAHDAELLEHIEDDPVAWADERLHVPYPQLRPHFSF